MSIFRKVGWKQGIRIGSAKGRLAASRHRRDQPEGMAADEQGTIFAGMTTGCSVSKSGGCIQKWLKK
jgi:hypothetical protein